MRRGPKPLSMHLGMTGANLRGQEKAVETFTAMVRGIQLYQSSEYKPVSSSHIEIWSSGQTSLRRILNDQTDASAGGEVCVLIPSLINGSTILDLCTERSLAQWLTAQGLDVYLLDWGDLMKEDTSITIEALVCDRLAGALQFLKDQITPKTCKIHVLGYCMGGALSVGMAVQNPDLINSLTLLATPWDFYAGEKRLLQHVRFWAPSALQMIEGKKYLGADQLQSLFASVDPMLAQKKFSRFSKMDMKSEEARIFVAVEDWLNEGKDLPAGIARECILDWFINNGPCSGSWVLRGKAIEPQCIDIPVHIVASQKDQLVEYEAALSLRRAIPSADLTEPDCGHIGMIAGQNSVEQVWQPMVRWMKKHSQV